MTLTDFLLARIAEDGERARDLDRDDAECMQSDGGRPGDNFPHRHAHHFTPGRILAECEAKRQIIALHVPAGIHDYASPQCQACDAVYCDGACPTLLLLALPYADHPDYPVEWKP